MDPTIISMIQHTIFTTLLKPALFAQLINCAHATVVITEPRPKGVVKMGSLVFYYDVVCPFAYMASRMIERVGLRAGVNVTWRPVLLGKYNLL